MTPPRAFRIIAALALVASVTTLTAGQAGAEATLPFSGTVIVDSGALPVPSATVQVKVCSKDGLTGAACLANANGRVTAILEDSSDPTRLVYSFETLVDPGYPQLVARFVRLELGDPEANSLNPFTLIPTAENVVEVTAGQASPTEPVEVDARYYELSGSVAYGGTDGTRPGVGACPAGNPMIGGTCEEVAFTFERSDHTYRLRLLPGDYRAAGFTMSPAQEPLLGIVNVLPLSTPPTTEAQALISLNFDANMVASNRDTEGGHPNGGDGNYDDVADADQPQVASIPSATDDSYVTIVAPAPVTSAVAQPLTALLAAPPEGATFPSGLTSFTVGPVAPGSEVTLRLLFSEAPEPGTEFWKYLDGAWAQYETTPVEPPGDGPYAPYALDVVLTDGGAGDYDGQVNGYITDPFAVAPPHQLSDLDVRPTRGAAHITWSITADGTPVAALPPTSEVLLACGTPTELTDRVSTDGGGNFHVAIPASKRRVPCTVEVSIPERATPGDETLQRSIEVP